MVTGSIRDRGDPVEAYDVANAIEAEAVERLRDRGVVSERKSFVYPGYIHQIEKPFPVPPVVEDVVESVPPLDEVAEVGDTQVVCPSPKIRPCVAVLSGVGHSHPFAM
jgi:hypothetical protein